MSIGWRHYCLKYREKETATSCYVTMTSVSVRWPWCVLPEIQRKPGCLDCRVSTTSSSLLRCYFLKNEHDSAPVGRMDVGRGGRTPQWILKFSVKKFFRSFEWENSNFTTFGPPPWKNLGKIPKWSPPGKNPSDAHGCTVDPPQWQPSLLQLWYDLQFGNNSSWLDVLVALLHFCWHSLQQCWSTVPPTHRWNIRDAEPSARGEFMVTSRDKCILLLCGSLKNKVLFLRCVFHTLLRTSNKGRRRQKFQCFFESELFWIVAGNISNVQLTMQS